MTGMLDILESERIFSVEIVHGEIVFTEECDRYYHSAFTPQQVRRLAKQLNELADKAETG